LRWRFASSAVGLSGGRSKATFHGRVDHASLSRSVGALGEGGRIVYARNLLQALQRRELAEVSARVTRETGLDYAETKPGDRITGNYRRMLTLRSGRFALIERAGRAVAASA
jgi:hypothetical protein